MSNASGRRSASTRKLFDTISKLETVKADVTPINRENSTTQEQENPLYENLKSKTDRYNAEKFIAAGGEKAVFSVYDSYSCRNVALARPIFHRFDSEKEQFIKEALICAKLQHPNIVPVYDVGVDCADIPYFTMKLFVGDTFKDILKKLKEGDENYTKDYDLNRLLIIFLKICDAIEYAHLHNVIHCDIKPENVHIDKFGSVLVGDWGLSKIIPTTHDTYNKESSLIDLEVNVLNTNPAPGSIRGTPGYLAPEILHGIHSGDVRSDIYSLGALLYEILSFEKPVDGKTPNEIFENTKKHNIKPLQIKFSSGRDINALKAIVMKALSGNTKERYRSVAELRTEITNYLQGFATSSEKSSYLQLVRLMIHRHKMASGLITGFTLLILVILFGAYEKIIQEKADAEIKRDIAEKNLYLFTQVNKKAKMLSNNLTRLVRNSKFISLESIRYRILALGYAINYESDETQKQLMFKEKAELHYVLQEFNKATECFSPENDDSYNSLFMEECKKFATLKPNDKELLTPDQLAELLTSPYDTTLAMRLFYLHCIQIKNIHPKAMIEPVKRILNIINNNSGTSVSLSVDQGEAGSSIDLRYAPYTDFILPIETERPFNVLSILNPVSVDLSHSWFNDLSKIRGLKLNEINVTNTNIHTERLQEWIKKLKIKKMTVQEGQFSENEVEGLKKLLTLNFEAR